MVLILFSFSLGFSTCFSRAAAAASTPPSSSGWVTVTAGVVAFLIGCRGLTGGGPVMEPAGPRTGEVAGFEVAGDDLDGAIWGLLSLSLSLCSRSRSLSRSLSLSLSLSRSLSRSLSLSLSRNSRSRSLSLRESLRTGSDSVPRPGGFGEWSRGGPWALVLARRSAEDGV